MATRLQPPPKGLYVTDPYAWALEQAALLRARRFGELDLENLAEEVEDLAGAQHRSVRSRARTIIEHLLKLEHSPATEPRAGWRNTVRVQRDDLDDDLTPTLRRELLAELPGLYARARRRAAEELVDQGEARAAASLPDDCPYSLDQVTGDWLP
jgi:hypothetical protein